MAEPPASSPALDESQSRNLVPLRPRSHRGRPSGSKNKPKQPIIIARETPGLLRAHAMEVAPGCDVSACVASFSRRLRRCVCVLSGSGCVTNVTLRQTSANSSVTLHGRFEILSLLGTFLPTAGTVTGLTVFLSGAQGQMVGGGVVGPLVAAGRVVVMAASFANVSFERLPAAGEEEGGGGLCNGYLRRRDGVVYRPVQLEEEGGFCGVLPSVVAGGTLPQEFCAWLAARRQVGKK